MPTPQQVLENNDLQRCISEHRDVGHFRWLPDTVALEPSGIEFVQYELGELFESNGSRIFPCQLSHDPCRPRDAHAMQIRTVERIIGYVPADLGFWWQQQFDLLRHPQDRLVGLCRITYNDGDERPHYEPRCEFRVQLRRPMPRTA